MDLGLHLRNSNEWLRQIRKRLSHLKAFLFEAQSDPIVERKEY